MKFSFSNYGEEFGGFLQVSGMVVKYDGTKDVGSRILSIEVDGKIVEDDDIFTLVTTDYVAYGGNGNTIILDKIGKVVGEILLCFTFYLGDLENVTESTIQMGRLIPIFT